MRGDDERPTERSEAKRWGRLALRLAVLGLLFVVGRQWLSALPWGEILERLRDARPAWVAVAVGCLVGRFGTWDQRWRVGLAAAEMRPRRGRSWAALQVAVLVNHVTPAARVLGGLVRARYVQRAVDRTFGSVYGVVLFDVLAHQIMIVIVTGVALIATTWLTGHEVVSAVLAVALIGLAGLGSYLAARPTGRTERWGDWFEARARRRGGLGQLMVHLGEAFRVGGRVLRQARIRRITVILGLGVFLFQVAAQAAVYRSLGLSVSLIAVFVALAFGNVTGGVSGIPGGMGAAEAGMVFSSVLLGVDQVEAVMATLLFRGLHYSLVIALGVPAVVFFEMFDPLEDVSIEAAFAARHESGADASDV